MHASVRCVYVYVRVWIFEFCQKDTNSDRPGNGTIGAILRCHRGVSVTCRSDSVTYKTFIY